jgi:hypothetical protein
MSSSELCQVPFQSSCGVLWTLYLSILNSDKGGVKQSDEVEF